MSIRHVLLTTLLFSSALAPGVALAQSSDADKATARDLALGVKRPGDPGQHIILASAPGFAAGELSAPLATGKSERVTLDLKPRPDGHPPVGAGDSSTQKTIGLVALGIGAAGLLMGGITGGLALGKHSDITKSCPDGHCSLDARADIGPKIDSYTAMGNLSTIGFIAGSALTAASLVLILTSPPKRTTRAALTPLLGLGLVGAKGYF